MKIAEIKELLLKKEKKATEILDEYFRKAQAEDSGNVDALLEFFDDAHSLAENIDKLIVDNQEEAQNKKLLGVPVVLKDNILYKGHIASAASKMLEDYKASYSATVTKKLLKEGAVIFARANMDEFAMGSSTESSAFKKTKNPHDKERVPGGSSGGSAAAVAAGFTPAALGTDTGGSIRQPASFCGTVGFKPSYGAVSRFGLIAMGSSLDQAGPLTLFVKDAKVVFDVLRGKDLYDNTSVPSELLDKNKEFSIKKIGIPRDFLKEGVSDYVIENLNRAEALLKENGYEIMDIKLPSFKYALAAYYIIMPAEVSTNLARFDGLKYGLHVDADSYEEAFSLARAKGFGKEVKRRILLGSFVLSSGYMDAYYYKAVAAREYIKSELDKVFEKVDVIMMPTSPSAAFKFGEKSDPLSMYAADIFTVPVNIAQSPAISVPFGSVELDGKKLPLSVQFMTKQFYDLPLLEFAEKFEEYAK